MKDGAPNDLTPAERRELLKDLLRQRAARPAAAPLSYEQRRLYTAFELAPESAAYNLLTGYRLEGPLDVGALRWSLERIVARHRSLRTAFVRREGEAVQEVREGLGLAFAEVDLTGLPATRRAEEVRRLAHREAGRPFDLASGRVHRFYLLRLGAEHRVLLAVLPHIVADAWSFGVLHRELQALYDARRRELPDPLPPLRFHYTDFVARQREDHPEEALARGLEYWRQALHRLEVSELPGDFPRSPLRRYRGAIHASRVPERLLADLDRLAREHEVSGFAARLAVFQALLFRSLEVVDLSCAVPVANRGRAEDEALIGFFVNTAVVRTSWAGEPDFSTVLGRVRESLSGALRHAHVPFDRVVEHLNPPRDPSRHPFYGITFQAGDLRPLALPGIEVSTVFEQDYGIVRADLEVYLGDDGRVVWLYDRDLYRPDTIAALARRFLRLWEGAVAEPGRPVAELPLHSAAERHAVVHEANDTATRFPDAGATIHELVTASAARGEDAVAAVFGDRRITYGELERRANRLAHHLARRGVGRGVRVALRMNRSLDLLVALLAVLKSGAAYVPVSRQQPAGRCAAILEDSGAALVLCDAGELPASPEAVELDRLDLTGLPDTPPESGVTGRDLAYVIYTSGSTGRPKGVLIEHRSAVNLGHAMEALCFRDLPERRLRATLNAPIDFDASVQQLVLLGRGHCLVIVPDADRLDGSLFLRHLLDQQTEVLDCTPAHLGVLIDAGLLDEPGVGVRKVLAAGGAIDPGTWDRLARHPTIDFFDIYGPTECTVNATGHPIERAGVAPRIGRPLANYTAHLLDHTGRPVPPGVAGEICLGGVGLARGYVGRPGQTATVFVPDPFGGPGDRLYRTGDYGRRLEDGTLEFLGRRDDQVKIRGVRIELGEVEAHLLAHGVVREAAVMAPRDDSGERSLVAYVVPDPGARAGLADRLRTDLRRKLPAAMVPTRFVVLDRLPLTASGKLDRAALPRPVEERQVAGPARSPIEQSLVEIWASVLGVDLGMVDGESSFFELGGHSLLATRVTSRIRDVLQVELRHQDLFTHPTPAELARLVGELRTAGAEALPPIRPRPPGGPTPLSFSQERIWFIDQLEPGVPAYNIPIAVALEGALVPAALAAGIHRFVDRHDAMRTWFPIEDGRAVQRIAPPGGSALPLADLSGLPPERREDEVRRLAFESGALPFALARPPLWRATLVRLAAERHALLFCVHHIVSDAWSIRLMMDELGSGYRAHLRGEAADAAEVAAPAIHYTDYTVWQRDVLDRGLLDRRLARWRERLGDDPPVIHLPTDHPRPPAFGFRGGNVFFRLSEPLTSAMAEAAARSGVTVFMFLAAAVQLLLSRYTGDRDVWLGSPVANRNRIELEHLVGPLINLVVLRGDLRRDQGVGELLDQARHTVLEASDLQDVPFEKVVEAVNPERSLGHSPLFQCMLTFQNDAGVALDLEGVEASLLPMENTTAKLDLTFDLGFDHEHLHGRLEYSSEIFDRTTALRLAGSLEVLIGQMAGRPEARIGELSVLGAAARRQVTAEWNDTALRGGRAACLHELFDERARAHPDRVALVCGGRALSYGALASRVNRLARHLLATTRSPRPRIGVFLPRSPEMAVATLAVLRAGGHYVPLDPAHPDDRIRQIVESGGVERVLSDATYDARLAALGIETLRIDRPEAWAGLPDTAPVTTVGPDDLAYVIFTSGSTGVPKGVVLQHRPVVNLIEWVNSTHGVGDGDTLLFVTSLCFDLSVYDLFGTFAAGATVCVADDRQVKDPELLVDLLVERAITFWDSAPTALTQLVPFFDPARTREAALRLVFLSGDWIPLQLPPAVWEAFPAARVVSLGGATEAAIWSNHYPVREVDPEWKSVPYGRPIRNARYYVLTDDLRPCPIHVAGDLYIGGGCLSLGYLGRPGRTAVQYLPDPFAPDDGAVMYCTGDRARFLVDGNLEFLGRLDAQVKIRGFRIELGEIEAVLESHPAVRRAVVTAPSIGEGAGASGRGPGDRRLVAYVQPQGDDPPIAVLREEIGQLLAEKLPEYMVPSHLLFLERWPMTANGKLDRDALPEPRVETGRDGAADRPRTPAQAALARIWAEVLGVERVGVNDNFFSLGGDSILAIQIVARAAREDLRVRPRDFFQSQTIAAMLPVGGPGEAADGEDAGAPIASEAAPTPIQRWFFERALDDLHHFDQAVLLEWKGELDTPRLRAAVAALCDRHDALRLRFDLEDGGRQRAEPAGAPGLARTIEIDLSGLPAPRADEARQACATALQGSLHVARGPLVAAGVLRFGPPGGATPPEVLLAIHHLAVDGVSWRILLADLSGLYRGGDEAPRGEARSWMAWASRLEAQPPVETFRPELPFWLDQGRGGDLALDLPGGENRERFAATVVARLSREETEILERRVPPVYRTRPTELLLAALAVALNERLAGDRLAIDVERHGRHDELAGFDPSGTVGWFTNLHPLRLDVAAARPRRPDGAGGVVDWKTLLPSIKEQVRAVPRHGLGYGVLRYLDPESGARLAEQPRPEIVFNYLGRFDESVLEDDLFRVRPEGAGRASGPGNRRDHRLEIDSLIVDGRFETRWRYGRGDFLEATVEGLAGRFIEALRAAIDHCLSPGAGALSPSDFPRVEIEPAELARLVARHPGVEALYPATPTQRGMLFHAELDPETGVYVQQIHVRVPGALDAEALRGAWHELVGRHESLRTVFHVTGDRHLQVVLDEHRALWHHEDWSGLGDGERHDRLERFLADDLARGFDAAVHPPVRIASLRLGEADHRLVLTFHHAILDGWSLALLMEEISELYRARTEGRPPALDPAPSLAPYVDRLARRASDEAEAFWTGYLAGFRRADLLLRGREADARSAADGQVVRRIRLPRGLDARIAEAARERKLTPSTIFQAAWALLVGRYGGSDDVVVGVTTSGREQGVPRIERMLGLFINTLPLRLSTADAQPVRTWLRRAQDTLFEIRHREDSSLGEIQGWSELPPGRPLFESLVVVENYPFREALVDDWLGHGARDVRIHERANYPLSLLVELRGETVLELAADGRYFEPRILQRMLRHLKALLAGLVADGAATLGDLQMLDPAERHQLVSEPNDTGPAAGVPRPATLFQAVAARAAEHPDRLAVAFGDTALSFGALLARVRGLARRLRHRGVRPGDRVALLVDRSVTAIVGILAVQRAGAAHVPLDRTLPSERLALLLEDCRPRLVLSDRPLDVGPPVLDLDLVDWSVEPLDVPIRDVHPGQPAYVIYTSGSTGRPKGVVIEHRSLVNLMAAMHERVYAGLGDELLAPGLSVALNAPFAFDASMQQIAMLGLGHTLRPIPADVREDGAEAVDFLERHRIEGLDITPTHLDLLVAAGLLSRPGLALRRVVVAGGAVGRRSWERLAASDGARFYDIYGPTECTVNATGCEITPLDPRGGPGAVPRIGRPLAGYRTYVLDPSGRPVPRGVPGELFVGGAGVAQGYHDRPALSAERFVPDPFGDEPGARLYATGDLVRTLPDGALEFLRRVDLQVKVRGFRVELEEIESVLSRHPAVTRAVVVLDAESADDLLVAYYTGDREAGKEELRAFLRRSLPHYMVPAELVRLEALPLTKSGKVARERLPALRAVRSLREPPATSAEERLTTLWADVLGVEPARLGVTDDFLSLGGHSLNATLLRSRLEQDLGLVLTLKELYEGMTIRQAAQRLEAMEEELLGSDRAAELLSELEGLSQDEVLALLGESGAAASGARDGSTGNGDE